MDLSELQFEKALCVVLGSVGPQLLQAGNRRNCAKFIIKKAVQILSLLP